MHGVSEGIENGGDIQIHVLLVAPDVGHRHGDEVGESAGAIHADAHGVRAQVATAGQAVAAAPADHVSFATHDIAGMRIVDIRPDFDNLSHELITDRHGHRNGALRPVIPVVDVQIRAANAGAAHANHHVVDAAAC